MSLAYACNLSWNPLCQLEGDTLNFLQMYLVVIVCSPDRHQKVRLMMCLSSYSCAFILVTISCIKYFPVDLCFHKPTSVLQFQFSTCKELLKSAAVCTGFKLLMHRSYKREQILQKGWRSLHKLCSYPLPIDLLQQNHPLEDVGSWTFFQMLMKESVLFRGSVEAVAPPLASTF
jgi:hypothetical protein